MTVKIRAIDAFKNLVALVAKPELSRIHRLKDVYKGQSCYLLGDGVSMKWFDLQNFADKPAIPLALIPFHNQFKSLHVEYTVITAPYWFYPIKRTTEPPFRRLKYVIQSAYRKQVIARNPNIKYFVNLSNYPVLRDRNVQFVFRDLYDERLSQDFLTHRFDCFTGSLRFGVLLAAYFGCDRAFLVGCDYTHFPARHLHWYEKGPGIVRSDEPEGYQKDFFKVAQEFVDLTTITLDGKSDVLDYVTYKEHTGSEPIYRENDQLLDASILEALSTWPGYSIF